MKNVPRSGQAGSTGSAGEQRTSRIPDHSYTQLEIFNLRTLRKLVVGDPGDSKDTKGTRRTQSGTGRKTGG